MALDIRLPIGLLFATLGALLVVFGLTTRPALYQRSLGININLWWGLAMLAFGVIMAVFGLLRHRAPKHPPDSEIPSSAPPPAIESELPGAPE